jgi:uncharacterized hydrophobic protein (TIGR00341 family)
LLLSAEKTEPVLDVLEKHFSSREFFRINLIPVEATIPRPEEEPETPAKETGDQEKKDEEAIPDRIHREELYEDIRDVAGFTRVYVVMVILSSVVATIGILRNNVAIIIGAMVIAPLLGPNVALSLATTLGDLSLGRQALKTIVSGIMIALVLSVSLGIALPVDPTIPEIASRTQVGFGDVVLALASGIAGSLAFTAGLPSTLIGVMVAVALLPPLVTFGLLMGSGYALGALGAMLLFSANLICVNLSGVGTFLVQGIRPLTWWEADRAKKATRTAMVLWGLLLLLLILLIVYSQRT